MLFVYTVRTHANTTPKATRATINQWLKCSEASQQTAIVGNLQVQCMGHYLGLTLLAPITYAMPVNMFRSCIVMQTAVNKNQFLI